MKEILDKEIRTLHIVNCLDSTTTLKVSCITDTAKFNTHSYNQAFSKWHIQYEEMISFPKNFFSNLYEKSGTGNLNNFNRITQSIKYLEQNNGIKNIYSDSIKGYYIFLIPVDAITRQSKGSPSGFYMSYYGLYYGNSHVSFLACDGVGDDISIAIHEVSHIFQLGHTFEYKVPIPQGTTNNYLDYNAPNMYYFFMQQMIQINPNILK